MNTKLTKPRLVRGALYGLLSLTAPLAALAAGVAEPANLHDGHVPVNAVLLEKVRAATERYKEVFNATGDGFVVGTPCVSGPDFGAMGVHYVRMDRVKSGVLAANQPQALIYEPLAGGGQRLVGVEYIILAEPWDNAHPNSPPALDGNLFNLVATPNRFGLPAFYELHVWAWEHNPNGNFADWNTRVVCDHQPGG